MIVLLKLKLDLNKFVNPATYMLDYLTICVHHIYFLAKYYSVHNNNGYKIHQCIEYISFISYQNKASLLVSRDIKKVRIRQSEKPRKKKYLSALLIMRNRAFDDQHNALCCSS